MSESHFLPILMFYLISFIALTGISPSLNIALVGIIFGFIFVGFDLFLKIPSQIYDHLYNLNWLSIPLAIYFSCLARNLITWEEIQTLWKNTNKKWIAIVIFISILPINLIFTGLIGGTGTTSNLKNTIYLKKINNIKFDVSFAKISQLISVSLIPPSLVLLVIINSIEVNLPQFFSLIILPAFLYALLCQIFFFLNNKKFFIDFGTQTSDVQTEKKRLFVKVLTPYLFLIFFLVFITNNFLSINEILCLGVLFATALLIFFNKKNLTKSILLSSYKQTSTLCAIIFFSYISAHFFLGTFRSLGGDDLVLNLLGKVSNDVNLQVLVILSFIFLFQFLFSWLEVTFVLIPLMFPILSFLNVDFMWFLILVCFTFHNVSFSTPLGINSISLFDQHRKPAFFEYLKKYFPLFCIQIVIISIVFLNPNFFIIDSRVI